MTEGEVTPSFEIGRSWHDALIFNGAEDAGASIHTWDCAAPSDSTATRPGHARRAPGLDAA